MNFVSASALRDVSGADCNSLFEKSGKRTADSRGGNGAGSVEAVYNTLGRCIDKILN